MRFRGFTARRWLAIGGVAAGLAALAAPVFFGATSATTASAATLQVSLLPPTILTAPLTKPPTSPPSTTPTPTPAPTPTSTPAPTPTVYSISPGANLSLPPTATAAAVSESASASFSPTPSGSAGSGANLLPDPSATPTAQPDLLNTATLPHAATNGLGGYILGFFLACLLIGAASTWLFFKLR